MELRSLKTIKMALENQLKIPRDANVLAVCLMGLNRSPKLVEILQRHGYQNVAKLGLWEPMMPSKKRQIIGEAGYLVTLDPRAAEEIKERYRITPEQVLIELNVPEYSPKEDESRTLKTPEEIYDDIKHKIAPYL